MSIKSTDYIDKLVVRKYADMLTVNPSLHGIPHEKSIADNDIIKELRTFLKNANSCGCECNCDCEEESENTMSEEQENDIKEENEAEYNKNPNNMYERLGVDVLCILIAANIIPIVENLLLPAIGTFRRDMTDDYGYIIPNIRFLDSSELKDNEFQIRVRNKLVYTGQVELANNSDSVNELTKNVDAVNHIKEKLKDVCFQYCDKIICKTDAIKLMELIRSHDPTLVNDLIPTFISAIDLKKIMVNILKQRISIKDCILIFELLNDYARYTQDTDELTQKIIEGLNF